MHGLEENALEEKVQIMDLSASIVAHSFDLDIGYQTQTEEVIPVKKSKI